MTGTKDPSFDKRRDEARERIDRLTGASSGSAAERNDWFDAVYESAGGDAAQIPWADLRAKDRLEKWLAANPGSGRSAIDVACGLGDNAEALAAADYATSAFDVSAKAVEWAKSRFPETSVDYRAEDLFALPEEWAGKFDLVHECYTVQALSGEMRRDAVPAIAGLVAPGGTLLIFARVRMEGSEADGPPWPLMPSELAAFEDSGLTEVASEEFTVERPGRVIPHVFRVMRRNP